MSPANPLAVGSTELAIWTVRSGGTVANLLVPFASCDLSRPVAAVRTPPVAPPSACIIARNLRLSCVQLQRREGVDGDASEETTAEAALVPAMILWPGHLGLILAALLAAAVVAARLLLSSSDLHEHDARRTSRSKLNDNCFSNERGMATVAAQRAHGIRRRMEHRRRRWPSGAGDRRLRRGRDALFVWDSQSTPQDPRIIPEDRLIEASSHFI
nr:unnamed protein product [Digitaria exilis]